MLVFARVVLPTANPVSAQISIIVQINTAEGVHERHALVAHKNTYERHS